MHAEVVLQYQIINHLKTKTMETTIKKCGCADATVTAPVCNCGDNCPGTGCACGCNSCA